MYIGMLFVLFVLLFIGIAVIAGLIALFRKSTVGGVVALGVTAVIVLFVLFAAFFLTHSRPVYQVAPTRQLSAARHPPFPNVRPVPSATESVPIPAEANEGITITTGEAWLEAVDKQFEADIYPSLRAAVRGLGREVLAHLERVVPDGQRASVIRISGSLNESAIMRSALAEVLSDAGYNVVDVGPMPQDVPPRAKTNDVSVTLSLRRRDERRPAPWSAQDSELGGHVEVELTGARGRVRRSVPFIDKPSVEDFGAFVSSDPSRSWRLARSARFADSPHGARQLAVRDAVRQLTPKMVSIANELRAERHMVPLRSSAQSQLTDRVANLIDGGEFVVDRFAQRLRRPYGDVWREAILLDAQPDQLSQLAGRIVRSEGQMRSTWAGILASIMGLLMLICGVYLFLSFATKGYYDWALRLALIVIALACVAGVLLIA